MYIKKGLVDNLQGLFATGVLGGIKNLSHRLLYYCLEVGLLL